MIKLKVYKGSNKLKNERQELIARCIITKSKEEYEEYQKRIRDINNILLKKEDIEK